MIATGERVYRMMLRLLPASFLEQHEEDLVAVYHHRRRQLVGELVPAPSMLRLWWHLVADLIVSVPREHARVLGARGVGTVRRAERAGWLRWLRGVRSDLDHAAMVLRRAPLHSVAVMATLAIGIGGSTLVWSLMSATFLRRSPYVDAERLVWMEPYSERDGRRSSNNLLDFRDWEASSRSFTGMAAYWSTTVTLSAGELPERVAAAYVTAPYFEVLGVAPLWGRTFEVGEETPGRHRVAVVSHGLWQRLLGGDRGAIGRPIRVDGAEWVVIGVLPPGFPGTGSPAQLWVPMAFPSDHPLASDRNTRWMDGVIGRLQPGVSHRQADLELRAIARNLATQYPESNGGLSARVRPLLEVEHAETRPALLALGAGVGVLLLLGCVNVAGLLLARGTARRRDLALCAALGAGRGRLVRQLLFEAVLLAAGGGFLGAVLASSLLPATLALATEQVPAFEAARVDGSALLLAMMLSGVSALLCGLLPALRLSAGLGDPLRGGRTAGSGSGVRALRLLTGFEVALASWLLCGALLLSQTFARLIRLDPGFDPRGVLAFDVALVPADYPSSGAVMTYYERLVETLAASPDVESAAATPYEQPLAGGGWSIELGAAGSAAPASRADQLVARYGQVSPDYFRVLRVPLVRGRVFSPADHAEAPAVALLNETAASVLFGTGDPVGRRVWLWSPTDTEAEVIGVVGDLRVDTLRAPAEPTVYIPWTQSSHGLPREQTVLVRAGGDLEKVAPLARALARELDPHQPIGEAATLEQLRVGSLGLERLSATLTSGFAIVALLLAGLGLYGVVSYVVTGRRREIGVRLAIGGRARAVALAVVGPTLASVGAGLAAGLAGALLSGRWLSSRLFGVEPYDPPTLVAVTALLGLVAFVAAAGPCRRAVQVDPVTTLRGD